MVHIRGLAGLTITENTFKNNFVIDGFSPYASASLVQSNGILITDLTGSVDLSENYFNANRGIRGNNKAGLSPTPSGFSSRLIAFHRCSISTLTMDDVTFQTNSGVQQVDSPVE